MTRIVQMFALAAFLTAGLGIPMTFAAEPAPAEQKDKKDQAGSKADEQKKDEKKDTTGK
ncbi:MAG: hypothetical protein RI101_04210 [Nitrospira sp.]|jgi:hypothetical protein|nr:hypothetical protein [Nitrospira sp.]